MATRCTCAPEKDAYFRAPELHARSCPESLEQREIERLRGRIGELKAENDGLKIDIQELKNQRTHWIEEAGRLRIILNEVQRTVHGE